MKMKITVTLEFDGKFESEDSKQMVVEAIAEAINHAIDENGNGITPEGEDVSLESFEVKYKDCTASR